MERSDRMPPKSKFTRKEIINAAIALTREEGFSAVTARGLAARLGSSAKPVFRLFKNMEEVQAEVLAAAGAIFGEYMKETMDRSEYPPYKAAGMAYICFAKNERELFKLLFMRNRSNEKIEEDKGEIKPMLEIIMKNAGLSEEEAYWFHLEMWLYVHGMATMIATSYLQWDAEFASKVLTDAYTGLKIYYEGMTHGGGDGKKTESAEIVKKTEVQCEK